MKEKTPSSMHRSDLQLNNRKKLPQIRKDKPLKIQEAQILLVERITKKLLMIFYN